MGVYSTKGYITEADEDVITPVDPEQLQDDETAVDPAPATSDIEETAATIIAQNEANYATIMKSIGIAELAVYESTGAEMIYEGANIKGFFAKVKEFFVKLWNKVKGLFKKFFALIGSYTMKDKDFINKYKKDLLKVNLKDFTVKGYNYTNLNWSPATAAGKIEEIIKKETTVDTFAVTASNAGAINDACEKADREDARDAMRGAAIGKSKMDESEFTEELFKYFRKDEDAPVELENISITNCISVISGSDEAEKGAKKAFKETEKAINEVLKALDKTEKEALKAVPKEGAAKTDESAAIVKAVSNVNAYIHDEMNILTKVNGALLRAIKDANRQAKAICVKAINYRPKNEGFTHYTEGFLGNVVLK